MMLQFNTKDNGAGKPVSISFPVDSVEEAEAMTRAIAETELADREMGDAMAEVLGRMARNMARS